MYMPIFSSKINIQLIAETLINAGISNIVISPGSRNGGLTMQFVNDERFKCYSIVDERCAGFVALGMAQKLKEPVVLCCTSGSAALNYYPAIAEAFYQNIPLIVLTADRPANYVDLFDGQTIRQENVFEKHTQHNIQLSEAESDTEITNNFLKIKEAVQIAYNRNSPVHINMPFSEPLYEFTSEKLINFEKLSMNHQSSETIPWDILKNELNQSQKIMVLVGMQSKDQELQEMMERISEHDNIIILTETTSNLHLRNSISQIDVVLSYIENENLIEFRPDLLITLGQNVISKKIKQFLRLHPPRFHWHVDENWHPDTYFSLTQKIHSHPKDFLKTFLNNITNIESDYKNLWLNFNSNKNFVNIEWSDLFVFENAIQNFPKNSVIHYGNSAAIRYSQLFQHDISNQIYCNRGTSGIDGSTSTAIGYSMKSEKPTILVTGDISFFYDSNALWNQYIPSNFRIVMINNGGGNIFKIIPGPDKTNALEKFFETRHNLTAEHLAKMFNFDYKRVANQYDLKNYWNEFYAETGRPKILEIDTRRAANAEILKSYLKI